MESGMKPVISPTYRQIIGHINIADTVIVIGAIGVGFYLVKQK